MRYAEVEQNTVAAVAERPGGNVSSVGYKQGPDLRQRSDTERCIHFCLVAAMEWHRQCGRNLGAVEAASEYFDRHVPGQ